MTFLMLIVSMGFCIFILLCLDSMQIFKTRNKDYIATAVVLAVAFGIGPIIGTEDFFIPILFGGLSLYFAFSSRSFSKGALVLLYAGAMLIGLANVVTMFSHLWAWQGEHMTGLVPRVIILTILFTAAYLVRILVKNRMDINIFNNRTMHLLVVTSSIALIIIYINSDIAILPLPGWMVGVADIGHILFLVCIGTLIVLMVRYISKETKHRTEMLIAESSKKYIQDLEESYKSLRTIKHDYVNIMSSMKLRIDSGDIDGLTKYYYDELSELNSELLHQDKLMEDLHNLHISEVKSIFIYKCSVAAGYNIDVSIEARESIDDIGISTALLCQILGILLDNAIEAAIETENKKLSIAIIKNPNSKVLIIKNTWIKKNVAMNKLFELGYSTKGKERGVGLHTIRNYTDKINGVYLETELDDEVFTQILNIKDDNLGSA